jgi:hypothetical protein
VIKLFIIFLFCAVATAQNDRVGGQTPELIPVQGLVVVTEKIVDFGSRYDQQSWFGGISAFLYDDSLNFTPPNLSAPIVIGALKVVA